jgi:hypothetical protein
MRELERKCMKSGEAIAFIVEDRKLESFGNRGPAPSTRVAAKAEPRPNASSNGLERSSSSFIAIIRSGGCREFIKISLIIYYFPIICRFDHRKRRAGG